MKKFWRRIVSVVLALAMVLLGLPEYVSPVKNAKADELRTETVYVRTDTMTNGHNYLIVNNADAGSGYALGRGGNNGTTVSRDEVTIYGAADEWFKYAKSEYIKATDVNETSVWATKLVKLDEEDENSPELMRLVNDGYYLEVVGVSYSSLQISNELSTSYFNGGTEYTDFNWAYRGVNHSLTVTFHREGETEEAAKCIQYNNGFSCADGESASVYIFVEKEIQICDHEYSYKDMTWNEEWVLGELVVTAEAAFECSICHDIKTVEATVEKTGEVDATCTTAPMWKYTATISKDDRPDGIDEDLVVDNDEIIQMVDDPEETVTAKVFVLVEDISESTIKDGVNYLIVSSNVEGPASALANAYPEASSQSNVNDITVKGRTVKIESGELNIVGQDSPQTCTYIKTCADDAVWKRSAVSYNANGATHNCSAFSNGDYFLFHYNENNGASYAYLAVTGTNQYKAWYIGENYLRYIGGRNLNRYYYVRYNSDNAGYEWEAMPQRNNNSEVPEGCSVYYYEETEISMSAGKKLEALGHNLTAHAAVAATCAAAGNSAYWSCDRCGAYFSDEQGTNIINENDWVIPQLDHVWTFTGFEYIEDTVNGGYTAKAVYTCDQAEELHTEKIDADVADETTEATCQAAGSIVYTASITATASLDGEARTATETKTVVIPQKEHEWVFEGFAWTETEDGWTAVAKYKCENVTPAHEKEEPATVTSETTPATFDADGQIVYTATEGGHSEDKTVTIPAIEDVVTFQTTLNMKDYIGINVYIHIPKSEESEASQYTVETITNNTVLKTYGPQNVALTGLPTKNRKISGQSAKFYLIDAMHLASIEMTDTVEVILKKNGEVVKSEIFSVASVAAEKLADDTYDATAKKLLRAILQYGNYAQVQFKHNEDTMPVIYPEAPALVAIPVDYAASGDPTDFGEYIELFEAKLDCKETVSMNIYLTPASGHALSEFEITIMDQDGNAYGRYTKPVMKNGKIYFKIRGINSNKMDKEFQIVVKLKDTDVSATWTRSVITCAYEIYQNAVAENTESAKNVTMAMYQYFLASKEQFKDQ
ncbi:MAG: hypothetical protein J5531_06350 [Lachnospiraceae bacterium]|nr:hypothetical protein [Lachnospiraceae bacterium]